MPFFNSVEIGSIIATNWADFFFDIIKKLKEKKINLLNIARKIKYPSPLSRAFYPNLELKFKNYPSKKIGEIDTFIAEIMYYFYKEGPYCKNWTNILFDKEQINKNFHSEKVIWLKDLKNIKEIIQYNGYLRAITEMLFFYWDNFGHEIHGPYKLDTGEILLIREWHDLKPDYFKFSKELTSDTIIIYEIYKPETKIKIDISNRVFIDSRTDECLLGFYFQTPEKILSLNETRLFIEKIKKVCEEGVKEIISVDPEQLLEKAVHMHFYIMKPLADILGISWKPSEQCIERVKQGVKEEDKKPFQLLMKLKLDETNIAQLFDYRLKLPEVFYE